MLTRHRVRGPWSARLRATGVVSVSSLYLSRYKASRTPLQSGFLRFLYAARCDRESLLYAFLAENFRQAATAAQAMESPA
jgi:hypothetical protein